MTFRAAPVLTGVVLEFDMTGESELAILIFTKFVLVAVVVGGNRVLVKSLTGSFITFRAATVTTRVLVLFNIIVDSKELLELAILIFTEFVLIAAVVEKLENTL